MLPLNPLLTPVGDGIAGSCHAERNNPIFIVTTLVTVVSATNALNATVTEQYSIRYLTQIDEMMDITRSAIGYNSQYHISPEIEEHY